MNTTIDNCLHSRFSLSLIVLVAAALLLAVALQPAFGQLSRT